MLKVIRRHIKRGWTPVAVEHILPGCRIDLVFAKQRWIRVVEVKSANRIREVDRTQTALLSAFVETNEYVVSNGREDQVLDQSYIQQALEQAEKTCQFLISNPLRAARTYTPDGDVCYTCGNESCPYSQNRTVPAKEDELV